MKLINYIWEFIKVCISEIYVSIDKFNERLTAENKLMIVTNRCFVEDIKPILQELAERRSDPDEAYIQYLLDARLMAEVDGKSELEILRHFHRYLWTTKRRLTEGVKQMNKTDAEIIKGLECHRASGIDTCDECPYTGIMCSSFLTQDVLDLINRLKAENEDLFYKLSGIMLSVDKWLEVDELNQDEVQRAATMREKTLQITEQQQKEIERLKAVADAELDTIHDIGEDYERVLEEEPILIQKAKAEAIKEFGILLVNKMGLISQQHFNYGSVIECVNDLVKEMKGGAE